MSVRRKLPTIACWPFEHMVGGALMRIMSRMMPPEKDGGRMTVVRIRGEDEEVIDGLGRLRGLVGRGEYLLRGHDRRLDA